MEKTRVLLTVDQRFHSQLLKHSLETCQDVEVVGEATDAIECLKQLAAKQPHVWIHSWADGDDLAAIKSHVYSIQPGISIIQINPDEPAGYIQLPVNTLSELLCLATQSRQRMEVA